MRFSSEVAEIDLISQDGVSIRDATTMDLYELNAPDYVVCSQGYEVISVNQNPNKILRFDAVGYDDNELNRATSNKDSARRI